MTSSFQKHLILYSCICTSAILFSFTEEQKQDENVSFIYYNAFPKTPPKEEPIVEPEEASAIEEVEEIEEAFIFHPAEEPEEQSEATPMMVQPMCPIPIRGALPFYLEFKQTEGKGIGYERGYSTAQAVLMSNSNNDTWIPFADLRVHRFNDGKWAANGGMGIRGFRKTRISGINAYYDYRQTHHQHYNQVGFGLESLGKVWDLRVNGYFPVGQRKSHKFGTHSLEFDMIGVNAEVGAHIANLKHATFYMAAGPYYFEGQGKNAYGGKARFRTVLSDYFVFELSGSYDTVFKAIIQGQASIRISLGGRKTRKREQQGPCTDWLLRNRALQPVDRNEIIVVDRKHKHQSRRIFNLEPIHYSVVAAQTRTTTSVSPKPVKAVLKNP